MEDNSLYARQSTMRLKIPPKVAVIGLGGGGSWVAISLAMAGVETLVIMDNDIVEESNRNRSLFFVSDVGTYKTDAIKRTIGLLRPDCTVICIKDTSISSYDKLLLGDDTFLQVLECPIVIDATDNFQTRSMFADLYLKEKIQPVYCKLGYDGLSYEIDYTFSHIEDANLRGYQKPNTYVGTVLSEVGLLLHSLTLTNRVRNMTYSGDAINDMGVNGQKVKDFLPMPKLDEEFIPLSAVAHMVDSLPEPIMIKINIDSYETCATPKYWHINEDMRRQFGAIVELSSYENDSRVHLKDSAIGMTWCWHPDDLLYVNPNPKTKATEQTQVPQSELDYEIIDETEVSNVPMAEETLAEVVPDTTVLEDDRRPF